MVMKDVVMKEISWQAIYNLSTLVRNTSEFWEARPRLAIRKTPFKGSQDLEQQLHPRSRLWDTLVQGQCCIPQTLQALHSEQLSHPRSVLCAVCLLHMVYSDISCFSQQKSHEQHQIYLQITRGGAKARKVLRKLEEALNSYTQGWAKKNIPTSHSLFQTRAPQFPFHQGLISGQ